MKKRACLLLCVLLLVCISGCNKANGDYIILPMRATIGKVDKEIIDYYLANNDAYNYKEIRENAPNIISDLVNITPNSLKQKCSIYRFRYRAGNALAGETFLVYDNTVYPLGYSFGGYGVTEFACTSNTGEEILYYIYSYGSGMHKTDIGAFNFETKEMSVYSGIRPDHQVDIAFCLSEDGKTLGVCQAEIRWPIWELMYVTLDKGECLYPDINELPFELITRDE